MGERLLAGAADAFAGVRARALHDDVQSGRSPGQYAVAFAVVARDGGIGAREMATALGASMASSLTQAGVRLGLIGQAAAVRLVGDAAPTIARAVEAAGSARPCRFGAFAPVLEVAGILQPRLGFRMFAS
jgi:urease accessory protein UreF